MKTSVHSTKLDGDEASRFSEEHGASVTDFNRPAFGQKTCRGAELNASVKARWGDRPAAALAGRDTGSER
jgi:hypothetical protein